MPTRYQYSHSATYAESAQQLVHGPKPRCTSIKFYVGETCVPCIIGLIEMINSRPGRATSSFRDPGVNTGLYEKEGGYR